MGGDTKTKHVFCSFRNLTILTIPALGRNIGRFLSFSCASTTTGDHSIIIRTKYGV